MVFIKHAAVLDQLCNHKQAITAWSSGQEASCCCKHWLEFKTAALNPSDPHWVLAGSLLHSLLPEPSAAWKQGFLVLLVFSPFVAFPFVVLLVTSCFSPLFLTSVWLKLGPHFPCVSNQFPVEQHTMENSHGREIHYHLARALMHMNYIAGFLPFFEPSVDWDNHPQDLYGRINRAPPQTRHLHTFVPIPSSSSVPTLVSHGGMPSHMVLNPEPNLRPLSIRREGNPLSDHHPANYPPQAGHTSWSSTRTPASEIFPHTTTCDPDGDTSQPKSKSTTAGDSRPKKKQRSTVTTTVTPNESSAPPPSLPIIRDIPLDGFNSDHSEDANDRDRSPSNSAPAAATTVTHSTAPVNHPPQPPNHPNPVPNPPPIAAKSSSKAITFRILSITSGIPPANIRPWTDAEDQELCNMKYDTKSRPSWKTIGLRFRRDPEVCRIRWGLLKQMPEHAVRHEPEAED